MPGAVYKDGFARMPLAPCGLTGAIEALRLDGEYNFACATGLEFWARGEYGGERIEVGVGLPGNRKAFPDSGKNNVEDIVLTREWQCYCFPVEKLDLSSIKTGFL